VDAEFRLIQSFLRDCAEWLRGEIEAFTHSL
jgi:hypothetical protein